MEKMIDVIIEMDKRARLREQEAEAYKAEQLKALDGKKQAIEERYRAYASQEQERLARENEASIRQEVERLENLDAQITASLERIRAEKQDAWVNEIVNRALAGE